MGALQLMMRFARRVLWFLVSVAIGSCIYAIAQYKCSLRYRFECPMRMQLIYSRVVSARDFLRGASVPNLSTTISGYSDSKAGKCVFLCPGSSTRPRALRDVDKWTDYIYVDWSTRWKGHGSVPSDYPMLYDRRTAHHSGSLFVMDCNGRVFWDRNGSWLRHFASEHPEYQLTLPDGMK
jgi:hypothetical protein